MIRVTLRQNENVDSLIRRFNNAVSQDGILKELKERSVYEKPSVRKRKKALQRKLEKNRVK
jgi:small subunit ribosomal protein S21